MLLFEVVDFDEGRDDSLRITIKDIAQMANVSVSTVSRVVNNSKPVNEDVRRRVMEVLKKTNYPPRIVANQETARSLIGVIAPKNSSTVLDDFITGIQTISSVFGYETIITLSDGTEDTELQCLRLHADMGTQGVIFIGNQFGKHHLNILESASIACTLVGQISEMPSVPSVHVDNVSAAYEAVTCLIHKGHRDIAMIRAGGDMPVGGHRYRGYRQALQDAGISLREEWIVESEISIEGGRIAMQAIAETGSLPSAVFCSTDGMAIGAMNYLLDNGYRIPEDVSVLGFDGSFMSTLVRPQLSTVEYSAVEIGMTSTRNLIRKLKGAADVPQHSNVTYHLVLRGSTK
ncbi:LacI family DNA-binding transcriptional regulator [Paenibacillus chartarius]|uniref:LacI family DNA-binding transcriptional regulator n=1 Tax=Paenibacillus chartarius TaxID=747481 RepID=A0ABV6DIZ4_9BACL